MENVKEGEDFCPMCKGSGSHNLYPPNGQYYLHVQIDGPFQLDINGVKFISS